VIALTIAQDFHQTESTKRVLPVLELRHGLLVRHSGHLFPDMPLRLRIHTKAILHREFNDSHPYHASRVLFPKIGARCGPIPRRKNRRWTIRPSREPTTPMHHKQTADLRSSKWAQKGILTGYDTRLLRVCGKYVCTTGYLTRVWDLTTGEQLMSISHGETVKSLSLAFKPGVGLEDEGQRIWIGTSAGDLQEIDIPSQSIVTTRAYPSRREVIQILRHKKEMWTLDDEGRSCLFGFRTNLGFPVYSIATTAHTSV